MRKEFNKGYDETIALIKELKNSNDYLNKAIGVESTNSIALRVKREQTVIEQNITQIENLIAKLEGSYLDPDTARKIGTAKQQFRIQKDRRKQLLQSVQSQAKTDKNWDRSSKYSQITTFSSMSMESSRESQLPDQNGRTKNEQEFNSKKAREHEEQQYDEMGIEIQQKMMRQRTQAINQVSKTLLNVHNIIQETSNLTFQQGEKIDIIGDELFETYRNVREARENIVEADEHQRRAKRKYIYLSLTMMLVVAIAIGIVLV